MSHTISFEMLLSLINSLFPLDFIVIYVFYFFIRFLKLVRVQCHPATTNTKVTVYKRFCLQTFPEHQQYFTNHRCFMKHTIPIQFFFHVFRLFPLHFTHQGVFFLNLSSSCHSSLLSPT